MEIETYLKGLQDSKIHSLDQLIAFNKDHEETEFPPSICALTLIILLLSLSNC